MSAFRSIFNTLIDENGVSHALRKILEGDAAAAKEGLLGFAFKDASGNAVLPQLNNEGAVVVSQDAGTTLRNGAIWTEASQTKDQRDLALTVPLTADKSYTSLSADVSGTRLALVEIVAVDDVGGTPVETYLIGALVGEHEGQAKIGLGKDIFDTNGGTGTQELHMYVTPLDKESDMTVAMSVNEVA